MESMLAFLVQTLFALQGTTKRTVSYSSYHHLSRVHHLPSPPCIITIRAQQRDALFASPKLQDERIIDRTETLDWLQERLGLTDEHLIQLVKLFPRVHNYSIEDSIEPKLVWLQERLSLDDKSLSKLVRRLPPVLGYNIEDNLDPKLAWLQERLELDSKSLSKLVQAMPPVLGYSVEANLEPTIHFYEDCVGSNAAIQIIARDPILLGSSLENRLKPRLAQVQEAGIPLDTGTITRMAKLTEEGWSMSLAYQKRKLLKQQLKDR